MQTGIFSNQVKPRAPPQKEVSEERPLERETKESYLAYAEAGLDLPPVWSHVKARKYEPMTILGRGSFGTVVKAKNQTTGQVVAIKHIKVDGSKKRKMIQICRELAILEFVTKSTKIKNLPALFT